VRATNPKGRTIAVSILCSDQAIPIEKAVWLMFNRWLQENDFRYLDRHFGLNQLTSYASRAVAEEAGQLRDMPIDSPEYRELKSRHREAENELAAHLLKRENARDRLARAGKRLVKLQAQRTDLVRRLGRQLDALRERDGAGSKSSHAQTDRLLRLSAEFSRNLRQAQNEVRRAERKLNRIEPSIAPAKQRRDLLDRQLCEAVREQSRLRLLIDSHYRLLDTGEKEMLDALRITASNMFADLLAVFRPIYGNYRNDHVMLRNLTRADGFAHRVDGILYLRLWLKGRFQPRQTNALRVFLAEMSDRISERRYPGDPAVRITLLDRPPTW